MELVKVFYLIVECGISGADEQCGNSINLKTKKILEKQMIQEEEFGNEVVIKIRQMGRHSDPL